MPAKITNSRGNLTNNLIIFFRVKKMQQEIYCPASSDSSWAA